MDSDRGIETPGWPSQDPSATPGRRRKRTRFLAAVAVGAIVLVTGSFALAWALMTDGSARSASALARTVSLTQSDETPPATSLTQTIQRVLPSVVNINVTELSTNLFGQSQTAKAEGSGIILSKNGVILTNNHVVAGATKVTVSFTDGKHSKMTGTVLGTDSSHDLAIVKVDATDLEPISIGNSDRLKLGNSVSAIGFPLNLGGPTVTEGIVSGLNRDVTVASDAGAGSEHLTGLIQTDAAINPGNSGGPLIDGNGNLVGIDTAAASAASAENTGFAIAVNDALPAVKQLLHSKPNEQAWIGVEVQSMDPTIASQLGLPIDTQGALIVGTVPGSPAAAAKLKQGDVIQSLDGKPITSSPDLTTALAGHSPGDQVTLGILYSKGSKKTVDVKLGNKPQTLQG